MKPELYFLLILSCIVWKTTTSAKVCIASVTKSSRLGTSFCQGALIFEDNFDSLDLSKWSHEVTMAGGGNGEFQVYWDNTANSGTANGKLSITPRKLSDVYGNAFLYSGTLDLGAACTASWNNGCTRTGTATNILPPATSARLHTVNSFSFTYGRVEVRAKMPAGDWLWPAIWLMPWQSKYGQWPISGELDMMESRGNRNLTSNGGSIGVEQALSTMHWGPAPQHNRFLKTAWYRNLPQDNGWDKTFNVYQLEWTPDYIKFSINNVTMGQVTPATGGFWELGNFTSTGLPNPWINGTKMAPFDEEFFLILNVAVGGTGGYFPDSAVNQPVAKPWLNNSPQPFLDFWKARASQWIPTWKPVGSTRMQVDYVRVYAL